ncbi:hypothetical protein ACFQVC_23605 [Streptomyces monticola]|uniref:Lipoprotein n=1 Tax=Streptomyces monticola TaxID=2666263 RepID=A0ABW2JP15_9ACTN
MLRHAKAPLPSNAPPPSFLVVLLCLLVTACGGIDEDRVCTDIGGYSGVSVRWKAAGFADSAQADPDSLVARLCAQGVCESRTLGEDEHTSERHTSVQLDEDIGEVTVPVRFTVTSRDGGERVLFDERTDVTLRKSRPNGEHCPPTLFQGGLTADPKRGLTATGR